MPFYLSFLVNSLLLIVLMKGISLLLSKKLSPSEKIDFFFLTPFLSARSIKHATIPLNGKVVMKFSFFGMALVVGSLLAHQTTWSGPSVIMLSPLVYFMTEVIGAFGQLAFSFRGSYVFPLHQHPLLSESLGDFWGKRWNRWARDWVRDVSQNTKKEALPLQIGVSFFFSGLFHEVMFNLPLWLYSKENYFGTMMVYFLIQGMGLVIEKKYLRHLSSFWRRLYLWLVVILPSPLFLCGSFLKLLGISYG